MSGEKSQPTKKMSIAIAEYDESQEGFDLHVTLAEFKGKLEKTMQTKEETSSNEFKYAVFDCRHLNRKVFQIINRDSANSLDYIIDGSFDKQAWSNLKAQTSLASGSTYETLTDVWAFVRIGVLSTVADTPAKFKLFGSGQN